MKIICSDLNEALRILLNAQKEEAGMANAGDKLALELYEGFGGFEIDYTDAEHRVIRVYGLDGTRESYITPKEWKDEDICIDEIASQTISRWSIFMVRSALDYAFNGFLREVHVTLKQSDCNSVQIDTSDKFFEEGMDSMVDWLVRAKLTITFRDEYEKEDIIRDLNKWQEKKNIRKFEIVEASCE